MSCRIRAVEHRNCAAELAGAQPGLQDGILLNHTRIEKSHKVRKKTFNFLLYIEVQQTFSFPFSVLRHYQIPEYASMLKTAVFELVEQFYHATEVGNVANGISACTDQP